MTSLSRWDGSGLGRYPLGVAGGRIRIARAAWLCSMHEERLVTEGWIRQAGPSVAFGWRGWVPAARHNARDGQGAKADKVWLVKSD